MFLSEFNCKETLSGEEDRCLTGHGASLSQPLLLCHIDISAALAVIMLCVASEQGGV